MPFPKPALPAALGCLILSLTATAGTDTDQAIRADLPHSDPAAQGEKPAAENPGKVAPRPLKRLSDPYARLPVEKIVPAPPPAPNVTAENKNPLVLPKMTVTEPKDPARSLPRLYVHPPARNLPAQPFETMAAQDARLVKKHFTPFAAAFYRLLGNDPVGMARKDEALEISATQFNEIADLLELSAFAGLDDAAEQKKLRAEYLKAYYDRPR